jgi:hypothetical protein
MLTLFPPSVAQLIQATILPFSHSFSASDLLLPFLPAPTSMVATALLRAVVCVQLFVKHSESPPRGIIDFRMYKPSTVDHLDRWCVRRICTQKRKPCWSRIHAPGGHFHHKDPGGLWAPSNCDHYCFGPFVASWAPSSPSPVEK